MRRAVEAAEKALDKLTKERAAVQAELADPAIYSAVNGARVVTLQKKLADLDRAIAQAEETWLIASDTYEQARDGVA